MDLRESMVRFGPYRVSPCTWSCYECLYQRWHDIMQSRLRTAVAGFGNARRILEDHEAILLSVVVWLL